MCKGPSGSSMVSTGAVPAAQVKEAIVTSALLKLPQKMSRGEKMQRVEEILTELVRPAHVYV